MTASLREFAEIGAVLADKYLIESVFASGGMGLILAAHRLREQDRVAIKLPLPDVSRDPQLVARFSREVSAARRVGRRHAPHVIDSGIRNDGVPYFVMELLEGETLAHKLARSRPLSAEDAVATVLAASEAVAAAHARGVVHRDLKPANLFLLSDAVGTRTVKLLDFGIASWGLEPEAAPGANEPCVGSLPYMSPEQLLAPASVDARSDVWSLGVVLYECLTGAPPFHAERTDRICARILQEPAPPLPAWCRGLTPALARTVQRCLDKTRERRFPSSRELARELSGLAGARYPSQSAASRGLNASA